MPQDVIKPFNLRIVNQIKRVIILSVVYREKRCIVSFHTVIDVETDACLPSCALSDQYRED
jgi:hypothetical protein